MTNVVVLMADQLRADCLGCYGNAHIQTPHLDSLAETGMRFTTAFAQHPQCVPSRSSLITGRYPHVNGSTSNYVAMAHEERTLPDYLQAHGYYTAAIGKVHLFDEKEHASYRYTMLSGGQTSNRSGPEMLRSDYANWLKANGYWPKVMEHYANRAHASYRDNFQAVISPLPIEAYYDVWVGDRACDFLHSQGQSKQPFYLFVGFPNPHNPFEPPQPYASLYDPAQMPIPTSFHSDLSQKPPQHLAYKRHGRASLGLDFEELTEDKLRRVIAHYYASITLVDEQVGKILATLDSTGLADDTIIVFLSDHGELLGHHGLLLKSTDAFPMLYDVSLHVPLVIRAPGIRPSVIDQPVELLDLFPTLMDLLDTPPPPQVQGHSLLRPSISRETVFAESGAAKMLRGHRFKLVHYAGQPYGELYDLADDPQEQNNLYARPEYAHLRAEMTHALLDRLIMMEAPLHGESKRGPAYWRTQYQLETTP